MRWLRLLLLVPLLVSLGGCVVYPAGYGGGYAAPRPYYGYGYGYRPYGYGWHRW